MSREISERLTNLVNSIGWTQEKLAKEIHSSRQTINRWVTGKVPPTRNSLSRVANATGCSLEWLLTGNGEMFDTPDWAREETNSIELAQKDDNLEHLPPDWLGSSRKNRISDLLTRAAIVLESSDAYRIALAATINALYKTIEMEKELTELKQK
ncbi:helix-turn-helix transcriptional regulator [Thiovibrio sp. JS02]